MKNSFFWVILLFFYLPGSSQISIKYGKLSKEEKAYQHCEFEPEAEAVYLEHIGEIEVNHAGVVIKKHIRIKILNDNGLKYSDVAIPFYSKDGYEKITHIKAQTINLDDNGRMESFEIDKKQFYTVEVSENWSEVRFSFPNVKAGSILEYDFEVISENYLYLDKWEFQHNLPTIHSGLTARIPEYLEYRVLIQGYRLLQKYRDKLGNSWELENLPSIKKEPYLYNISDYTEKIKFQLSGYREKQAYGGGFEYRSLLRSWDDLAQEVTSSWPFTSYMNKKGYAKDILEELKVENLSSEEKIRNIYNYVKLNFQWNGGYRRSTYNKFNDFIDKKSGYSSEINLLLTLLLTEAGINASPMLISTRSHGLASSSYSFLSQFDHIITFIQLDDTTMYLDATDPLRPYDLLSKESTVNEGFVLDKKEPKWQKIEVNSPSSAQYAFVINIQDENFGVQSSFKAEGHTSVACKKELLTEGKRKWLEKKIDLSIELTEDSLQISHIEDADQPLHLKGSFGFDLNSQNSVIYINPYLLNELKENPFKNDSRFYPVQFPHTKTMSYRANFIIPDNYEIVELPKSERVKLPNGYSDFTYIVSKFGNSITMQVVYHINTLEVPTSQYQNLREYHSIIVSKLNQQMVLKKK